MEGENYRAYLVETERHDDPATKEIGTIAHVTHFGENSKTVTTAWATTEDEAVAKALRDNHKLRVTEALGVSAGS